MKHKQHQFPPAKNSVSRLQNLWHDLCRGPESGCNGDTHVCIMWVTGQWDGHSKWSRKKGKGDVVDTMHVFRSAGAPCLSGFYHGYVSQFPWVLAACCWVCVCTVDAQGWRRQTGRKGHSSIFRMTTNFCRHPSPLKGKSHSSEWR